MTDYSTFDSEELLALADWQFQKDDYQGAIEKIKALFARNSMPLETFAVYGRICASIGLLEKAKDSLLKYIDAQEDPNYTINERLQLGMVEKDMGNHEGAIEIWDSLLSDRPNFTPALYHKSRALVDLNRLQDATDLLNQLLETAEDGDSHIAAADQLLNKLILQ